MWPPKKDQEMLSMTAVNNNSLAIRFRLNTSHPKQNRTWVKGKCQAERLTYRRYDPIGSCAFEF